MADLERKLRAKRIKKLEAQARQLGFDHSQTKDKAERAAIKAKGEAIVDQIRKLRNQK